MGELAAPFAMSLPAVSRHLKVLERAGLIARGREAQWRPCRLEPEPLREVAGWLDDLPPALGGELRPPRRLSRRTCRRGIPMDTITDAAPAPTTRRSASSAGWRRRASWSSPPGPSRGTCGAGARRTASTFRSPRASCGPGGGWRAAMRAPDGTEHRLVGTYREIVPPERLVFTHAWLDEDGAARARETLVTVTFEAVERRHADALHPDRLRRAAPRATATAAAGPRPSSGSTPASRPRLEPSRHGAMVGSGEEPTMDVNIYLSFDGRCAEAFDFYARVLGGTVEARHTWGETPNAGDMPRRGARQDHACAAARRRPDHHGRRRAAGLAQQARGLLGVGQRRRTSTRAGGSSTRWPKAAR